jgi:hypothetical protein
MNAEAVQDWLKVRRNLLQMEAAFTDLAIKVANGEFAEEVLQAERQMLEAYHELCRGAYERAFPAKAP